MFETVFGLFSLAVVVFTIIFAIVSKSYDILIISALYSFMAFECLKKINFFKKLFNIFTNSERKESVL